MNEELKRELERAIRESDINKVCNILKRLSFAEEILEASEIAESMGAEEIADEILARAVLIEKEKSSERNYLKAQSQFARGNLEKALELAKKAVSDNPFHEKALELLSVINRRLGKRKEAKKTLRKLITINPNKQQYYRDLALMHSEEGNYEKALSILQSALKVGNDFETLLRISDIYLRLEDPQKAVEFAKKAYDMKKDSVDAVLNLSGLLAWAGDFDEAVRVLKEALETIGDSPLLFEGLSIVYERAGDIETAISFLEKAAESSEDLMKFLFQKRLVDMYLEIGNADKAIEKLKKMLSENKGDWERANLFSELSGILASEGLFSELVRIGERLLRDFEDDDATSIVAEILGDSYKEMRLFEKAIVFYKLAMKKSPDNRSKKRCFLKFKELESIIDLEGMWK